MADVNPRLKLVRKDYLRVLYIGVYRDSTGWGQMALNSLMALHAAGVDVVARPVKLNSTNVTLPEAVLEMESKRGGNIDAVIQNVLPHDFDYDGRIPLNIGYYCTETTSIASSSWPDKINTLDRAWVCSQQSARTCHNSGIKIPYDVIPIACDVTKYQRNYKPLSIRERLRDSFIFYYIGDFNKRKNILATVKAFHLEFDVNEPVNLVIKTDIGRSSDEYARMKNREAVVREIDKIKTAMKLYPSIDQYKKEIVLIGHYTEEEIMRLHASCDCFVCPSYGEAWCIPAFDAMAMGKTPIVSEYGGFLEYADYGNAFLVPGRLEPVFGMNKDTFDDMFSSREEWFSVDINQLRRAMRNAYENKDGRKALAVNGRIRAYDFSYEKVGKRMVEALTS